MSTPLSLFAIGLIFGGGIGFTLAAGNGITFDGHDHANPAHHTAGSDHSTAHATPVDMPAADAPQIKLAVSADPMAGYNLHVMTQNFAFSPENASLENVAGEGHAHIYVNGDKLGRLYGPWFHIDSLPQGDAVIKVTLNTNDHRPITVDGVAVSAAQTLTIGQ